MVYHPSVLFSTIPVQYVNIAPLAQVYLVLAKKLHIIHEIHRISIEGR